MTSKTFQLQTLTCPSCINKIANAVKSMTGVEDVEVLFNSSRVKVDCADEACSSEDIRQTIENLGYEVLDEK
ncbi:heavy-metal-associated domain-containing protein [Candidatus Saccharibacteria bacterium]|nr:heavy-metal-associated domain-containing protein [Candidatus Saccharibacteria bacterium]